MDIADLQEAYADPAVIIAGLKAYGQFIEHDPTISEEERTRVLAEVIADILMAGG